MSYVFSKAINRIDIDEKLASSERAVSANMNSIHPPISTKPKSDSVGNLQRDEYLANNIKPSIPEKPIAMNTAGRKPPVKRKPMIKSQSVDLTQVGGSEWKDFVEKRRMEKELNDPEEIGRFATVKGLAEHRGSLFDQTISEDQILQLESLALRHHSEKNGMPQNGTDSEKSDTESVKSETSENSDVIQNEPDRKLEDLTNTNNLDNNNNNKDTTCTATTELKTENTPTVVNTDITPPSSDRKDNVQTTAPPATAITLPKPRQISSELKRNAFKRNRAMSLPVISYQQSTNLNPIKKSSDFLKDSASKDSAKVPYFLRNSRGSVEIQESLPEISDLDVNESSDSATDSEPAVFD